jgi:hypothetical protein
MRHRRELVLRGFGSRGLGRIGHHYLGKFDARANRMSRATAVPPRTAKNDGQPGWLKPLTTP